MLLPVSGLDRKGDRRFASGVQLELAIVDEPVRRTHLHPHATRIDPQQVGERKHPSVALVDAHCAAGGPDDAQPREKCLELAQHGVAALDASGERLHDLDRPRDAWRSRCHAQELRSGPRARLEQVGGAELLERSLVASRIGVRGGLTHVIDQRRSLLHAQRTRLGAARGKRLGVGGSGSERQPAK
jgi:hypothetical protein